MFGQLNFGDTRRHFPVRTASILAHGVVLLWLLHAPTPIKLTPNSVMLGQNGKSVTRLYWSSKTPDESDFSSADAATQRYRHERLGGKLAYQPPKQLAKVATPQPVTPANKADNATTQTLSAMGHGALAGTQYGAMYHGTLSGDEVRPALPVTTSDPVVWPWQLPTSPGNEIIEITIDERGAITNKTVLQSLGPDIDTRCLAALENWRFHPATRNGSPIPSKQDAIFPFKARG